MFCVSKDVPIISTSGEELRHVSVGRGVGILAWLCVCVCVCANYIFADVKVFPVFYLFVCLYTLFLVCKHFLSHFQLLWTFLCTPFAHSGDSPVILCIHSERERERGNSSGCFTLPFILIKEIIKSVTICYHRNICIIWKQRTGNITQQ